MQSQSIEITAAADCPLVAAESFSERIIEIRVLAGAPPADSVRPPLNLALVIDRSGSMQGGKLESAQEAACQALRMLDERDRAAVVAFDDHIDVLAASSQMTQQARSRMESEIRTLTPRASTNLGGGWLKGADEVARNQSDDAVNRILLLTDGQANRGIRSFHELGHHARELYVRGVSTSAFGLGTDFNEMLLESMATRGGGHFYYIEAAVGISAIFTRELGEMLGVVAKRAALRMTAPAGVEMSLRGDLPFEWDGPAIVHRMGDIFGEEERYLYLIAQIPPGRTGEAVAIRAEIEYRALDAESRTLAAAMTFRYAPAAEVDSATRDSDVAGRAAQVSMEEAVAASLVMEREGRMEEAADLVRHRLGVMADALPAGSAEEYAQFACGISSGLQEEERKERHALSYTRRSSRR